MVITAWALVVMLTAGGAANPALAEALSRDDVDWAGWLKHTRERTWVRLLVSQEGL